MMKSKKKLAAGAMAFTLALGGGASAFAATPQNPGNAGEGAAQHQQNGQQGKPANKQAQVPQGKQQGQAQKSGNGRGAAKAPAQNAGGGQFGQQSFVNEDIADLLGITLDELKSALKEGSTIAGIAEEQDVDVDEVIASIVDKLSEKLDKQVDNGKMTEEQYEAAVSKITERVTSFVNGSAAGEDTSEDSGDSEDTDGAGYLSSFTADYFADNEDLADVLGLTTTKLAKKIDNGKTLAELAEANDVDTDDVVSLLSETITAELDAQLDSEDLTEDEYNAAVGALDDYATDLVNGEL